MAEYEYKLRVRLPLGDTDQSYHGFDGCWQDRAGVERDMIVIEQQLGLPKGAELQIIERVPAGRLALAKVVK